MHTVWRRGVGDDNGFVHISRDNGVFFVINGVVHFGVSLTQRGNVYSTSQEQIADVEEPLFVQWNTGRRGKRDRNFFLRWL